LGLFEVHHGIDEIYVFVMMELVNADGTLGHYAIVDETLSTGARQ
jgi:hypothetical protein